MNNKTKELQEIFEKQNKLLEIALKKNNKKWARKDIVELLAKISIYGKNILHSDSPKDCLNDAKDLIEDWYFDKSSKDISYENVEKMYNRWSKSYDFKPNLAVFLEEKVIVKWFNYKDKNILDLGCGTGRYSIPLGKNNSVVGVDISEGMLKIAKQKAIKNKVNISFIKQDITKYAAKDRFDVIVSMLVQDHIKNLKSLVKNIDKASKIGTELIISNVHPIHTLNTIKNKNKAIVAKDLKFSTDQYYHPLSEYMALLGRLGFVLEDYAEPLFLKKYLKIKAFSNLKHLVNKPIIAIYKFKKIR